MNHDEILQGLYDQTLVGNAPAVLDLTNEGLATGLTPERMLFEALIPSLEEVGARFERGDFFVPEMLIAGKAMSGALDVLRPLLAETGAETVGKFVMGTVKGDVHDIGKNLVNIMLEGAGFEVIDLGVQVAPEKFIAAIEEHKPDIVGFSAFLTTTMPMFKANINALQKAGLRDKVIVMVGGAPVTQEYADAVGADGYAADASAAVKLAKSLIKERRARWRRPEPRETARPRRARGQEAGLRLSDVRHLRAALDGHDLPDELSEDAAQRPVRRSARERALRGEARDALRLGAGERPLAVAAAAAGALARGAGPPARPARQPVAGNVVVEEPAERTRPADAGRLERRPMSSILQALCEDRTRPIVTAELPSVDTGGLDEVRRHAEPLREYVDAVNATDNPAAHAHASNTSIAIALERLGIERRAAGRLPRQEPPRAAGRHPRRRAPRRRQRRVPDGRRRDRGRRARGAARLRRRRAAARRDRRGPAHRRDAVGPAARPGARASSSAPSRTPARPARHRPRAAKKVAAGARFLQLQISYRPDQLEAFVEACRRSG